MSRKYQFNDLQSYNHTYYWEGKQQYERNNQSKNAKFKNKQRLENNINQLPQTIEQHNDNYKCNCNENIQVSQQNVPQKQEQNNHKNDFIQNNCQQTEYQEKTKDIQKKSNINSSNDSFDNNLRRRRKSQIDWLYSTQINQDNNILILDRVKVQNVFSPSELIHLDENQILYEIEEIQKQKFSNCKIIECKFMIQKSVKRLRLLQLDVLLQCSKCKQIIQAKTNVIKKTQSPAILINHCNQNIRIDFFHNHNQNPNNQENQFAHVAYVDSILEKIVIIRAECAVICKCDNENDSILILENPLQLKDGNYTLLANEPYRKLCRYCCKEVILQQCEFMIVS